MASTPNSFIYQRAMAQQEKGGKTWRVVTDLVKHCDGTVTFKPIHREIPDKPTAKKIARRINHALYA